MAHSPLSHQPGANRLSQSFTVTVHLTWERAGVENSEDRMTLDIPEGPRALRAHGLALVYPVQADQELTPPQGHSQGRKAAGPPISICYFSSLPHSLFAKLLC